MICYFNAVLQDYFLIQYNVMYSVVTQIEICLFVVCFLGGTLANNKRKVIDNLSSGYIIHLHKL